MRCQLFYTWILHQGFKAEINNVVITLISQYLSAGCFFNVGKTCSVGDVLVNSCDNLFHYYRSMSIWVGIKGGKIVGTQIQLPPCRVKTTWICCRVLQPLSLYIVIYFPVVRLFPVYNPISLLTSVEKTWVRVLWMYTFLRSNSCFSVIRHLIRSSFSKSRVYFTESKNENNNHHCNKGRKNTT